MKRTTSLLTAILLGAATLGVAEEKHDHKHKDKGEHHETHAGHMLEGYQKVQTALYQDKLKEAKAAAADMADHDEHSKLAKPALAIADAKDLKEARKQFQILSAEAIKLAKHHDKDAYVVMNCPMVKGGKGDWLQKKAKSGKNIANNPYMGARMPHCGGPKKK